MIEVSKMKVHRMFYVFYGNYKYPNKLIFMLDARNEKACPKYEKFIYTFYCAQSICKVVKFIGRSTTRLVICTTKETFTTAFHEVCKLSATIKDDVCVPLRTARARVSL